KFAMFIWLVAEPSRDAEEQPSAVSSWVMGVAAASLIGLVLVIFGTKMMLMYSWGLVLGVPFVMGFASSWIFNRTTIHTVNETVWVSFVPLVVLGVAMLVFGLEGLICMAMALPLAAPGCLVGGVLARNFLLADRPETASRAFTACVALL